MSKDAIKTDEIYCHEPERVLSRLLSFHALAASSGGGLHPRLLALAEQAADGPPTGQQGNSQSSTCLDRDRAAAGTTSETGGVKQPNWSLR